MGNTNRSGTTTGHGHGQLPQKTTVAMTSSTHSPHPSPNPKMSRKIPHAPAPGPTGPNKRSTRSMSMSSSNLRKSTSPDPMPTPAPPPKLTTEQKRLVIEMKQRHEEDGWKLRKSRTSLTISTSTSPPATKTKASKTSAPKSVPSSSRLRSMRPQRECPNRSTRSPPSKRRRTTHGASEAAPPSASSTSSRRTRALWILNCEAEEFLFGETAAEINGKRSQRKRRRSSSETSEADDEADEEEEVKPPEVKRRRGLGIRPSELGHLLSSTTEFKDSKLRNHCSSSSSYSPGTSSAPASFSASSSPEARPTKTQGIRNRKPVNNRRKLKKSESSEQEIFPDENSRDSSGTSSGSTFSDLAIVTKMLGSPGGCSSGSSGAGIMVNGFGNSNHHHHHQYRSYAAKISELLSHVSWNFGFETVPSAEPWYRTFKRQFTYQPAPEAPLDLSWYIRPNNSNWKRAHGPSINLFPSRTLSNSIPILPYETKYVGIGSNGIIGSGAAAGSMSTSPDGVKRRLGSSKLARKSPRCHASTQAILSSYLMRSGVRRSRSSSSSPVAVNVNVNGIKGKGGIMVNGDVNMACPSPSVSSNKKVAVPSSPSTPSSVVTSIKPKTSYPGPEEFDESFDSATSYLWTSIQFLSDSYVLGILAGGTGTSKMSTMSPLKLSIPTPKSSPSSTNNSNLRSPTSYSTRSHSSSSSQSKVQALQQQHKASPTHHQKRKFVTVTGASGISMVNGNTGPSFGSCSSTLSDGHDDELLDDGLLFV